MSDDYGPVPISRLKEESLKVFDALEAGRRVLVSRSGRVVAAIEPASVERHATMLAAFAVPHADEELYELSATSIGQGSPSRAVRAAEEGHSSLITRNNKVFGVMTAPRADTTLEAARASEDFLAEFERTHPDATPTEFAAVVDRLDELNAAEARTTLPTSSASADLVLLDALLARASTLASVRGGDDDAEEALREVIKRFERDQGADAQRGVAISKVALAKLYSAEHRTDDALKLLDQAVATLESI